MKIGVIGSSGFIGRHFVREVLSIGYEVIGWDIVEPFERYEEGKFAFYHWKNDEFESNELFQECDAIIILAAKRPHGKFSMEDYFENIDIVMKTLDCCIKYGVKNIITISSRSVYSDGNIPWREENSNVPLNLYGAAKEAADELVLLYNREYELNIKSLRLAQVIGLGEVNGYLLNTFISNAYRKQALCVYGTGNGRRQYIYIKDVIDAILKAINSENAGVYNIGMKKNTSCIELAEIVNLVFENDSGICYELDKPEDLKEYLMDVTKAEEELGWRAKYDVLAAMKDIKKILEKESNG